MQIPQLLDLLKVYDVSNFDKIRLGNPYDGGYVILDDISHIEKLYSYGINDDISFEGSFIVKQPVTSYLYDPTINSIPKPKSKYFTFSLEGIAGTPLKYSKWAKFCMNLLRPHFNLRSKNKIKRFLINKVKYKVAAKWNYNTLESHIKENGDSSNQNLFLKLDVEGAEYAVLRHTPSSTLQQFSQIVMEAHNLGDSHQLENQIAAFENLNKTHQLIHVHYNNYAGDIPTISGSKCPRFLELTFIRKDSKYNIEPSTTHFPTKLDFPNNINYPDVALNFHPFPH